MIAHGKDIKIFSGNSNRALADAMLRYIRLDDATKQSFCAAARERAERIFDVSIVIKAYKKILQKAGV